MVGKNDSLELEKDRSVERRSSPGIGTTIGHVGDARKPQETVPGRRNESSEMNRYEQIARRNSHNSNTPSNSKGVHASLMERYDRQFSQTGADLSADRRREKTDLSGISENGAIVQALKESSMRNAQLAKEIDQLNSQLVISQENLAAAKEVHHWLTKGNQKDTS